MLTIVRIARSLVVVSAALATAACGGAAMSPAPAQPTVAGYAGSNDASRLKHAASIVYVGSVGGFIDTFTLVKGKYEKTAQLEDGNGPEGIHTDADANMYVADEGLSSYGEPEGDIAIYAKGARYPEREIAPGYNVSDVIPVGINSYLYGSNFSPVGSEFVGPGSLSYYGPTGDYPLWTKDIEGSFQAWGLVRDSASKDVYVSYLTRSSSGEIARFVHGGEKAKAFATVGEPRGMAEDGSRHILVASGSVYIFSRSGKSLGSISVPGFAYRIAFNRDYSLLYVTNFYNYDVEIFSYPAGKLVGTITSSDWSSRNYTDGIAVWPPPQQ